MPTIITAPVRTRSDKRAVTDEVIAEYIEAMDNASNGQIVVVDESESDNYEKSYAKGERIRQAAYKVHGDNAKIKVIAWKDDEGTFRCGMAWKA